VHCTKISAEFEFGDHNPWVYTPKNVALGYHVEKISAGCLVIIVVVVSCQPHGGV